MKGLREWMIPVASVLSVSLLLAGCAGEKKPSAGGGGGGAAKDTGKPSGKTQELAVAGTTTIKGRVTYNGDGEPKVNVKAPTKDVQACPKEIPQDGWYCKGSKDGKGVQYAVVFLKAPAGFRLPKSDSKPSAELLEIGQPKCQFEPRVIVLHPDQNLRIKNDSQPPIQHDSNIASPRNSYQKSLKPGESQVYELQSDDREPNKVNCGAHTDVMSAYVWKPTHAYAAVTDAEGNFEIKNVPVPEGQKLSLVVWHEMLPGDHFKDLGALELEKDKPATKDIAIPK